jgi:FAD/FMN-containing dehydrogenase
VSQAVHEGVKVSTDVGHLFAVADDSGRPDFSPTDVDALVDDLIAVLGPRGVSQLPRAVDRASRDGSGMSPVITAQLDAGELSVPDVVCYPRAAEEVPEIMRAAVRHGVPVTTRGKGTGNYGQVLPRFGGLVLDMTSLTTIHEIDTEAGTVTADAGAKMLSLESYAQEHGQQLWMYPSTVQSTLGGFLGGGSAGTGTIVHGRNHEGFVTAVDIVPATADARIIHLEGEDAQPYVHTYGVAGVIVRATVKVEPLGDWRSVYASFPDRSSAFAAATAVMRARLQPRLMSADGPDIVAALPDDEALVPGRGSVRGILDVSRLPEFEAIVADRGGRMEASRTGVTASVKLSTLSYNHPTWWLQKKEPGRWFHMECQGTAVVDRFEEVLDVYSVTGDDGTAQRANFHLEVGNDMMFGMLNGPVLPGESIGTVRERIAAGVPQLEALGVSVHSPHQWYIDLEPERVRRLAADFDPYGLLNPGRWM